MKLSCVVITSAKFFSEGTNVHNIRYVYCNVSHTINSGFRIQENLYMYKKVKQKNSCVSGLPTDPVVL